MCVAFDSKKMKTMSLHTRKEEGRQEGNEMCLLPLSSSYAQSFKHRVATTAVSQSSFLGLAQGQIGKIVGSVDWTPATLQSQDHSWTV